MIGIIAGVVALGPFGCAETSCEETRTCPGSSAGGAAGDGGGSGGTGAWGASGGTDGGGTAGTGGIPPVGSFGIITQSALTLTAGSSVELEVTVTRNEMTDPITVNLLGLPNGVTSEAVIAYASDSSVKLTLAATASVAHTTTTVTVTGTAGIEEKTAQLDLTTRGTPGSLDNGFGVAGEVSVNLYNEWSRARALALAADGKIYVAGEAGSNAGTVHAYFLSRWLSTGKIDPSFGINGTVVRYMTQSTGEHVLRSVIVDAQQRPVVAGYFTGNQVHIARFDSAGVLDPSFGTGGEATVPGGSSFALGAHGAKLVMAGKNDKNPAHAFVARVGSDGVPDYGFGTQSWVTVDTGTNTSEAVALGVDADNKIVLAGNSNKPGAGVIVARITPGGAMDTFGTAGIAWLDPTNGGLTTGLAVRADKRVVVGGGATGDKYFLIQLDAQGAKDATFGTNGLATGTQMRIDAFALDATGRLVAVGRSGQSVRVARFSPTGSADASFANAGFADVSTQVLPQGIAVAPDGRVVIVGVSQKAPPDKIYLARVWM